jgi:uncharacterized membrane protein YbhN (UPF0104 family)
MIHHDNAGVFHGLSNPFEATRCHSLVIRKETFHHADFVVSAWTEEGEIMGIRHRGWPLHGVQFHPESFLTLEGPKLLRNFSEGLSFLDQTRSFSLALVHSVVVWTVIVLQFWFMLLGMNFHFSVSAATLVMVGAAIGSVAQIPGIGGGFQAGYVFCMTTFFIVPPEQAIAR